MEFCMGRALLYCLGFLLAVPENNVAAASGFLAAVAADSLRVWAGRRRGEAVCLGYGLAAIPLPALLPFLPVILYGSAGQMRSCFRPLLFLPALSALSRYQIRECLLLYAALSAAYLLGAREEALIRLRREYYSVQDETKEEAFHLKKKNRELLEKQDYEVHLATLEERNRIAREIHDNVGHLLTRALLQMSALLVVYRKKEEVSASLSQVKNTLEDAMDNIRSSVHDLKEESFDLNLKVSGLLSDFSFCPVKFRYDGGDFPREVKYCFLAVIKEALSNIARHSGATKASILLIEHPALYQLVIEDNGTSTDKAEGEGIGLANMQERVEKLGGNFHTDRKQGFRIFVSIPKGKKGEKKNETADR